MRKTGIFKRICAVLLSLSIAAGNCAVNLAYADADHAQLELDLQERSFDSSVSDGQKCGDNAEYSFDPATGTLEIFGSGHIYNYGTSSEDSAPWAEYRESIQNITIGSAITGIGNNAFRGCTALSSITIPSSVERVGQCAFAGCSSLTSAEINASVIEYRAFYGCSSLSDLKLTYTREIHHEAFHSCNELTNVDIPVTIKLIYDPFHQCLGLKSINVPSGNSVYATEDGVLYNKDMTELMFCPAAYEGTELDIPDSVMIVRNYAFENNQNLEEIRCGKNVRNAPDRIFQASHYFENWTELSSENVFSDSQGNKYLIFGDTLIDIAAADTESDMVLDLKKTYTNGSKSVRINNVHISGSARNFNYITNIISDHPFKMNLDSAQKTSWYDYDGYNVVYDTEDPANSSYSFLYRYSGDETTIHAEDYSGIGEYAFYDLDELTLYLSSDMEYIDPLALFGNEYEGCVLNGLYVDDVFADVDYLKIPNENWIKFEEGPNFHINDEYKDTLQYKLVVAVSNNSFYSDKIVWDYCEKVLEELHINDYKTDVQKARVVFDWLGDKSHFTYGHILDENGTERDILQEKHPGYYRLLQLSHWMPALPLTEHGVCSAYSTTFKVFMDILDIPCLCAINPSGSHEKNLVQLYTDENDPNNNLWYYVDLTTDTFGGLGKDFVAEGETAFIQDKNNCYGQFASENYEGTKLVEIEINSYVTKNVKISADDRVYFGVRGLNEDDTKYVAFAEKSYFKNFDILVGNDVVYTIEYPASTFTRSGSYEARDCTIYYDITNEKYKDENGVERQRMTIDIKDSNSLYISYNDRSGAVAYYTVRDLNDSSAEVLTYTEKALVPGYSKPCITFYDKDGCELFSYDRVGQYGTMGDADVHDHKIAYRAYMKKDNGREVTFDICKKGDITMEGRLLKKGSSSIMHYLVSYYRPIVTGSLGDLTIKGDNIVINGDLSANESISLEGQDAYINGKLSSRSVGTSIKGILSSANLFGGIFPDTEVQALYDHEDMMRIFFDESNTNICDGDYLDKYKSDYILVEQLDPNGKKNYAYSGRIELCNGTNKYGTAINASMEADGDIIARGTKLLSVKGVLYSKDGDITLSSANDVTIDGFIYAPNGTVTISGNNVKIQGSIVAKDVVIDSNNNVIFDVAAVSTCYDRTDDKGILTLSPFQLLIADMNYDGAVTIADAVLMNRAMAEQNTVAPAPKPSPKPASPVQNIGDINGDNVINVSDVSLLAAQVKGFGTLDDDQLARADVDGDGIVSVADVSLLASYVKGL